MGRVEALSAIPKGAIVTQGWDASVDYADCYRVRGAWLAGHSVDYLTAVAFSHVPRWVRFLERLRDRLVRCFGLQTGADVVPVLPDPGARYEPGADVVFFQVLARSEQELVLGEQDRHLDFRVSVLLEPDPGPTPSLSLTTVVHFHNVWGRLYFLPVRPFHRLIVRRLLASLQARVEPHPPSVARDRR